MDATRSYEELAKDLNTKAQEFDKHICSLKQLNDDLVDRTSRVLTALNALVGNTTLRISCSICCTRPRNTVMVPCGHGGVCDACATRCERRGRCPTCRGPVEGTLRVFM
mgnify:CR=1 FL=1